MVEEGGIHKAARRLGLSQPPLSMALKDLERELDCQLIFRQGRNWIVTDAGRRLYEEGRDILARAKGLRGRVQQPEAGLRGIVRAGFSTSCVSMFEKALSQMILAHPQVSSQVMFSDSESLARHVRRRLVDFAILYLPLDASEYEILPLRPQRLIAVFSSHLPPPPPGELDLRQICEWPLMLPRRWNGGGIYSIFARAVQNRGLNARVVCQSQDTSQLRLLLDSIPAVAILPQCEAAFSTRHEERLISDLAEPLTPAVATLKNTWLSMPALALIELVKKDFG